MKIQFRSDYAVPLMGLIAFAMAEAQGVQESQCMQARYGIRPKMPGSAIIF